MKQDTRSVAWAGPTIGVDLGDRHSHVCVLDERGELQEQSRIKTTRIALERRFERAPRARIGGHWRKAYDEFEGTRNGMGVKGAAVFQTVDDPNDVTVWHDFDSREAAQAFASSGQLKQAMARAGVVGAPTIWFTTEA